MTIPDSIAPVPDAGTILGSDGEPLTQTAEQWTERLRALYLSHGIEANFRPVPDGVLAEWGDVEMTHTIGHPDVEAHVQVGAAAMRRGPLWRGG